MIRNLFLGSLIGCSLILGSGCSTKTTEKNEDKLNIVVSIPPQKYLFESIGGNLVDVKSVMTSDANPESFEPTVATMLSITDADAYIPLGLLDFEKPLLEKLKGNAPSLVIFDGAKNVSLLYDTHGDCDHDHHSNPEHHHHGRSADPHVWSSVRNMRTMADNTADVLMTIDPEHAGVFKERRDSLINRLDSIDNYLSDAIRKSGESGFLVWHPSLSYMAKDYDLKQIVVGSHAKELSVRQLQQRIDEAATSETGLFFIQSEFDTGQISTLNGHVDARIVELNTMSEDWENEIRKIADGFAGKQDN